jgi:hypothetical protein
MAIKLGEEHFGANKIITPEGEQILAAELSFLINVIDQGLPLASKDSIKTKAALRKLEYNAGQLAKRESLEPVNFLEELGKLKEVEGLPGEVVGTNQRIDEANSTIARINTRIAALNTSIYSYNMQFDIAKPTTIAVWQAAAATAIASEEAKPAGVGHQTTDEIVKS